jgi:hypothetical protein
MTHTIQAEIRVQFRFPGMPDDERETAYPTVDIEFDFVPGCAATGPSYASGGGPADPAECNFIGATLIDGNGLAPTAEQVDDWARDWLHDAGYEEACELATRGPDPDAAYEQARDDQLMGFDR